MNMIWMVLQEAGGETSPLFSLNTGVMIWTIVIFLILVFILGRYAWRPILGTLEARERRIQEILDAAVRDREEAERILEEHRRELAASRQQAQQIVAEGRQAAERVQAELLETARRQQEEILTRAQQEIAREREQAILALRREAVDLSLAAASKLLEKKLDAAEDRRLVEQYLTELSASAGNGAER